MSPTTTLARTAYGAASGATKTPRALEYDVFARCTAALGKAQTFPERVEALDRNRRLWTLIATLVADQDNAMPADLRARLFYLHEFTEAQSRKVLSGEADVSALIEVNRAIMAGLAQKGQRAA